MLRICLQAYSEGRLASFVEAFQFLRSRLEADPLSLGEPVFRYKHLDLLSCVAVHRPLVIHYAVDEVRRLVYLREIAYHP